MKNKRMSLVDEVVKEFLEDVSSGKYQYGEKLPSQEMLAQTYEVSRIVIREALNKLSVVGIITVQQGKGTFLKNKDAESLFPNEYYQMVFHDQENLFAILEARRILEKETCHLAAERASVDELLAIETTVKEMKKNINNKSEYAKWDLNFHIAVAKASGNQILAHLINVIRESYWNDVATMFDIPGIIEKTVQDHTRIYEEIKKGNGKKAAEYMTDHLIYPEKYILENKR